MKLTLFFQAMGLGLLGASLFLPFNPKVLAAPTEYAVLATGIRVTDRASGFSIIPPVGWQKTKNIGKSFLTYVGDRRDHFTANLNVNVNPDDGTNFRTVGPALRQIYAKTYKNWVLAEEGITTIANQDSYYISSKMTQGNSRIQNLQYFIRGHGKVYVLTFTSLEKVFARQLEAFKASAMSVQTM